MAVPINYLAVLVAAIANMVVGALWYGPLFGKAWMQEMKITEKDMKKAKEKGMASLMIINFIGTLITAYVLAHFVGYLSLSTFMDGLQLAFWVWLGFFAAATLLGGVLWEGKPWKLFGLNVAYYLVVLSVMASILAVWV